MATKRDGTTLKEMPPVVREALLACTPQQRKFVIAYCGRAAGNGQLAMKIAGSKGDYSTRATQASTLLREPEVREAVDAWMTTYAMSAAEITAKIADMAQCSLEPFLEAKKDGTLTLREQDDEAWGRFAHWIKSVEVDPKTKRVTKLQVHDALRASELMAKILKLFTDAPTVNLFMYLQSLSDEDLLIEYEQASRDAGSGSMSRLGPENRN